MEYKSPEERNNISSIQDKVSIQPTKIIKKDPTTKKKTLKLKPSDNLVHIKQFKKKGINYLSNLPNDVIGQMIAIANTAYYNSSTPLLSDNQYDIIKEYLEKHNPENKVLNDIGAPVQHKKVKLPYEMWSMDKIKPDTNAITKWLSKYNDPKQYVISAKLDGVSGLYVVNNGEKHLYTRGNGKIGQDVSHLIPYLNLPSSSNNILVIRGEFLIAKEKFNLYFKDKSNPRNTVSGIVNTLTVDTKIIKYVDFVAYECIVPKLNPLDQLKHLQELKINTVLYKEHNELTNEYLSALLVEWRQSYKYEIDGIIVAHNKIYDRTTGNPKHAFAFKMILSDQIAEAKVIDVLWSASKDGLLKPRIRIEPIELNGVKIEYATAFNAAFVEKNKLGIGAIIKIIRSGDVIPYIMEVTTPAPEAKMPDKEYVWNNTHIDIVLKNSDNDSEVQFKRVLRFFKELEVVGLGPGNIKKLIENGNNTIPKILAMTKDDYLKVPGFKEKTANKLFDNIHKRINKVSLPALMKATNIFGRGLGVKKIEPILNEYPNILISDDSKEQKLEKLLKIKGLGNKTAELFVNNIDNFKQFLEESKLIDKVHSYKKKTINTKGTLYNKNIVLSGFNDIELEKAIENEGGKMSKSVSKNTNYVVVRDLDLETSKANKGRELNILILEDVFRSKYL